ncbi:MAG: hypothetical protein M1819_004616 [Sarea resinae]|nr:MAG: hypothetical protein M1819_004616 [Sarea resinae]
MATFARHSSFDIFRSQTAALDGKHKFFEDDDSSILDDNILNDSITMSPHFGQRRDSFADAAAIFSPKDPGAGWGDFDENIISGPDRHSTASTNPFFEQSNNPFMRLEAAQAATYGQQNSAWAMEGDSGSCTPTAVYEGFPSEYESTLSAAYVPSTMGSATFSGLPRNPAAPNSDFPAGTATNPSIPPSPHSSTKDWMSMASAESMEPRSMPKRMRPSSPSRAHTSMHLRRDGIRKKNARFEIPAERNLYNIDQLIANSQDDHEIKELKQQKRLLRNRQAALDSRQRKKQHTERLEDEKKQFTEVITNLEESLAEFRIRDQEHEREKEEWNASQQQYKQYIDTLLMEKEEMVRSHTLETGDLRKKNAFLTEHIQKMESTSMSAAPSSSGFTDFSGMDNLTMEDSAWDDFSFINDFASEPESHPQTSLIVQPPKKERISINEEDKPAASGLLLMLLLCGAFVASKSSATSSPPIPRMPEDIRAASATVLDNIFKDAGVQPSDPRFSAVGRVEALEPGPSGTSWPVPNPTMSGTDRNGMAGSTLDILHHQLSAPTKEQEGEQLFSLSADQYNGVTSQDFLREAEPSTSPHRRNLGETLAAMRRDNKDSAAEVYTRSLMWDKIPTEVVRDFAKMVSELSGEQQRDDNDDSIG